MALAKTQTGAIMGLQFETLVLNDRKSIWRRLNISPEEIVLLCSAHSPMSLKGDPSLPSLAQSP